MKAFLDLDTGFLKDRRRGKRDIKVLVAIVAHADKHTGECWPSRSRLSELTGIHESNISSSTKNLTDWGYIKKIHSGGKCNRYRILKPLVNSIPVSKQLGVSKQLATPSQNDTVPLAKTATQNIPITKKEQTKCEFWYEMSFQDFQKLNDRPKPDSDFEKLWRKYRDSCKGGRQSEPGNKQQAWFEYLLLLHSGFEVPTIKAAVDKYSLKKIIADSKLAHFSNVLRDKDLLQQQLDEIEEEQQKIESVKIDGIQNRF